MLEVKEFTYVNIRVVFLLLRLRLLSTDVDGTVAERTATELWYWCWVWQQRMLNVTWLPWWLQHWTGLHDWQYHLRCWRNSSALLLLRRFCTSRTRQTSITRSSAMRSYFLNASNDLSPVLRCTSFSGTLL